MIPYANGSLSLFPQYIMFLLCWQLRNRTGTDVNDVLCQHSQDVQLVFHHRKPITEDFEEEGNAFQGKMFLHPTKMVLRKLQNGDKLDMPSFLHWCLCGNYIIWDGKVAFKLVYARCCRLSKRA